MGAFLVTFPRDQIRTILVIFVFVTVSYVPSVTSPDRPRFLSQVFNAGQIAPQGSTEVAYLAHIGGFMFGAVFARSFQRAGVSGTAAP